MKAISFASTEYLKTLLNPWTKGSNVEAAKEVAKTFIKELMVMLLSLRPSQLSENNIGVNAYISPEPFDQV